MANYVKDEGVYRCRLQLDPNTNAACIDAIEHFAWDRENKCLDESKPLGGVQVILRADAWKVLEDGTLDTDRLELNMENFGVTIITKAEFGEEVRNDVVANFVRIFGLRDASELLNIQQVNQEQLLNAQFDCRVYNNAKGYRQYWIAPVGEAEGTRKAFTAPSRNRSTLDKYRQKLRIECKGIVGTAPTAETPTKAVSAPPKAMPKPTKANTLPPREPAQEARTLNEVWDKWIYFNPDDAMGAEFYAKIEEMYPNADAASLTSAQLVAFEEKYIKPDADDDVAANLPF